MEIAAKYREKLTTAEQAVSVVQSGDWVDYGWCAATANLLDRALAKRYQELEDVKVRGGILFRPPAILGVPEADRHFTWHSWHISGVERAMLPGGGFTISRCDIPKCPATIWKICRRFGWQCFK